MSELTFPPNIPVTLSLVDPEGQYDFDLKQGEYHTTAGQSFALPKSAVMILNALEPRAGEEIQITRAWGGRRNDPYTWVICLTPRSEQLRAVKECPHCDGTGQYGEGRCHACSKRPVSPAQNAQDLSATLQASIEAVLEKKSTVEAPKPIIRPARKPPAPQPRLFDQQQKGTGTDGPAPQVAPIPVAPPAPPIKRPALIPWNVAFREVSRWVAAELKANDLQWSDASQQDFCSTVLIAEAKAGRIGPWERGE